MVDKLNTLSLAQKKAYNESTARINIFSGPVRAGKSFASLIRWIDYCINGPPGALVAVGKNHDTLKRNFIDPIQELCGQSMQYFPAKREMLFYGRKIYLVGANDERATGKIQGSTFAGAWVDEATLIPESFFKMLLSRLSIEGAKLFATTNPDSPYHWLKKDYIDRAELLDCKIFEFKLDDNPALSEKYKQALKSEYSGLWYKRYILGEWVLAEGTVYDFFDINLHTAERPPTYAKEYYLAIDYGTFNPFAALLIGYNNECHPALWVEKEYYYDSKIAGRQKTDTEYFKDLWNLFYQYYPIRLTFVDPSAASYIVETRRHSIPVTQANNDVLPGIRTVSNLMLNGDIIICNECKNLIQEFSSYSWDDRSVKLGEDKPIKARDHCLDALRYCLHSMFGEGQPVNKIIRDNLKRNPLEEIGPGWKRVDAFAGMGSSAFG